MTPLNYSGTIECECIIDGTCMNHKDTPRFKVKHTYITLNEALDKTSTYIEAVTKDDQIHVGMGSCIQALDQSGIDAMKNSHFNALGEIAELFFDFDGKEKETIEITKYVSIFTEKDREVEQGRNIKDYTYQELKAFIEVGFDEELKNHEKEWKSLWRNADIAIEGDREAEKAIRFNIFHLMGTASDQDDSVNIGARLLHGEEYGGHVFWYTELFILPFFIYCFPDIAKKLVSYRCRFLAAAKENAERNGFAGAQYPWESADDGTEQCPEKIIEPDGSVEECHIAEYEHHVNAAVALGIFYYVRATGDKEFLWEKGLEVLVETAKFWVSRVSWNNKNGCCGIFKVLGPDEWHEPVNNNLYTNYLAKWNIRYALECLEELKKNEGNETCFLKYRINRKDIDHWSDTEKHIYIPTCREDGVFEQFEGYFKLREVQVKEYDDSDWPVKSAELNITNRGETQIIKQADVVMLMYVLGEAFTQEQKTSNYDYYEKRTLHGSSLSLCVHAIMSLQLGDEKKAQRYFKRAAFLDIKNLQKNTNGGIHAANAGGVWQIIVFGFAGISIDQQGRLNINPHLPNEWKSLKFSVCFQGIRFLIFIGQEGEVKVKTYENKSVTIIVRGKEMVLGI